MNMKEVILEKQNELTMQIWALLKSHRVADPEEIARVHCVVDAELDGEQIGIEVVELLGRILNVNLKPEPKRLPELGVFRWRDK